MSSTRSVSDAVLDEPDLLDREDKVIDHLTSQLPFNPQKRLGDSRFWTRGHAGAVFYQGTYQNQPAVLKIQGTLPPVSEIDNIHNFAAQNQSRLIRPPRLLAFRRWNKDKEYEALILENIQDRTIISFPTNKQELAHFFKLFQEYRTHCLIKPWLPVPQETLSQQIKADFDKWRQIARKLFPNHPLRQPEDQLLIQQAVNLLVVAYQNTQAEFLHGHFGYHDLIKQDKEYILFSNLFWKYKAPFYDTIFAYHWFMYALSSTPNITPKLIDSQRQLWLKHIHQFAVTHQQKHLLNLALLERATAALNLDALTMDPQKPISQYLMESTRQEIKRLIKLLKVN